MILDTVNKSIELVLGSAVTTTAMAINVDYVDLTSTSTLSGSLDSASNGTTPVTIVAAPAASTQRKINYISVYNADTVAKIVTIRLNNNTVLRSIIDITLQVDDTVFYTDTLGWKVVDANGQTKMSMPNYLPLVGGTLTGPLSGTSAAFSSTVRTGVYTVATLPAGTVGDRAYVTDATAPTYNGALTGGGAVVVPVFRNATVWVSA